MRRAHSHTSVARAVLAFAISGLVVLVLIGVGGVVILRRIGTDEAMRQAERLAAVAAHGVIEPRLTEGILTRNADSLIAIEALVNGAVLQDPIVRVQIWDKDGQILYSAKAPGTIEPTGSTTYSMDAAQRQALRSGDVVAAQADLSLSRNRSVEGLGPLLEISVPIRTPRGEPLLFEAMLRFESVTSSARRLWLSFLPVLAIALLALAALQVPFAVRLARRVRHSQLDRERLLQRAIDSSDLERRRIAADLHDGSVQQLAGLSMSLSATADELDADHHDAAEALRDAAAKTRQGMRTLRAALMGIYPPTLRRAGLREALADLVAPLASEGVAAEVSVPPGLELPVDVESLLYRASREAIRNVVRHSRAAHVHISVNADAHRAVLDIRDDGVGFSDDDEERARTNGHVGLTLLGDLARDAGGALSVASTPGEGTTLRLEVPLE